MENAESINLGLAHFKECDFLSQTTIMASEIYF